MQQPIQLKLRIREMTYDVVAFMHHVIWYIYTFKDFLNIRLKFHLLIFSDCER